MNGSRPYLGSTLRSSLHPLWIFKHGFNLFIPLLVGGDSAPGGLGNFWIKMARIFLNLLV